MPDTTPYRIIEGKKVYGEKVDKGGGHYSYEWKEDNGFYGHMSVKDAHKGREVNMPGRGE